MIEKYALNLMKYNCESFVTYTIVSMAKKKFNQLPFQDCIGVEDIKFPGIHHQFSRRNLIHDLYLMVIPLEGSKYRFVIDFSNNRGVSHLTCRETPDTINKFVNSVLDLSKEYTFEYSGNFVLYKKDYIVNSISPNQDIQSIESSKIPFPKLELSGIRYKGSGPIKSIIIDTYPEDYSYFTIVGSEIAKHSLKQISKHLEFFGNIVSKLITRK